MPGERGGLGHASLREARLHACDLHDLNFEVADAEAAVDELNARGVEMERYEGFGQDEKGIARSPEMPVGAWFTDPAGNIICVHETFGT